MNLNYQAMITQFSQIIWPLPRISGLFLTMPIVSSLLVPTRIKVVFALAMAFICAPFIPENLSFLHFEGRYVALIAHELLMGLLMGFILQLVFQVFIIGGQLISMQASLGFATMVDPATQASVPLVSQFYQMMLSLMFLVLNGHLALFDALLSSFQKLPVGQLNVGLSELGSVIAFSGWMFKESVLVALPAILSLLIVNLAFGVMTRVAPQLNIFSLGFPISLIMGMVVIRISLPGVAAQITDSLEEGMRLIIGIFH
ncbi:Flagellar biosynthetic protein FliR [Legionella massiliensis]|uniref:Flagellar biosynthetic protein FliR n=1 Tax=Legionella massiliensis TaxID=1034943 RepID=A0A078KZX2_9GAMM|nr:flagellar biosynthetic protein FliR [Legionella massiliensis]CDZ78562.1 Flagellar biosynthetic protein FliR [Legionella massiliensis]CEE14300.1 Flagellar biosynthetic protein FliR [Legionella massiliensis]